MSNMTSGIHFLWLFVHMFVIQI